jgi:hypothetical protein
MSKWEEEHGDLYADLVYHLTYDVGDYYDKAHLSDIVTERILENEEFFGEILPYIPDEVDFVDEPRSFPLNPYEWHIELQLHEWDDIVLKLSFDGKSTSAYDFPISPEYEDIVGGKDVIDDFVDSLSDAVDEVEDIPTYDDFFDYDDAYESESKSIGIEKTEEEVKTAHGFHVELGNLKFTCDCGNTVTTESPFYSSKFGLRRHGDGLVVTCDCICDEVYGDYFSRKDDPIVQTFNEGFAFDDMYFGSGVLEHETGSGSVLLRNDSGYNQILHLPTEIVPKDLAMFLSKFSLWTGVSSYEIVYDLVEDIRHTGRDPFRTCFTDMRFIDVEIGSSFEKRYIGEHDTEVLEG